MRTVTHRYLSRKHTYHFVSLARIVAIGFAMNADDLTKAQYAALRNKVGEMLTYLGRLNKRMGDRGFSENDPLKRVAADALRAVHELHAEVMCRSIDGKGRNEIEKPPIDPPFTRTSAPRKHENYRLGRPRRETH